jgi:hypothetical protein
MSAWLSFIGGYAKGANEQIDEQRKKEDQYIQDRMKMVAATRLQKQKEAETQRAELKASLGKLSAYENFNAASKDERVALLGNPMLREQWLKDPTKPVSSVVTPDVNKTGKFANEQALIDSVQAKPSAVNDQTFAAFQQPRRSFGARVGTDMEGLKQNAARFGLKPEDLGWEQGGVELPDGSGFGTIKNEAFAPDTFEGMLTEVEKKGAAAFKTKDPVAIKAAQEEAIAIRAAAAAYAAEKKVDIDNEINAVAVAASKADPKSPEYKQLMQKKAQLEMIKRHGIPDPKRGEGNDDKLSQTGFVKAMVGGGIRALQVDLGDQAPKGQYIIPSPIPGEAPTIAFDKLDKDRQDSARAIVQKAQLATAMFQLNGQPPKTRQEAAALQEVGIYDLYMQRISSGAPAQPAAPVVAPPVVSPQPTSYPPAPNAPRKAEQILPVAKPAKPTAAAATGPITITRAEIQAIADANPNESYDNLLRRYMTAADKNGKRRYEVK